MSLFLSGHVHLHHGGGSGHGNASNHRRSNFQRRLQYRFRSLDVTRAVRDRTGGKRGEMTDYKTTPQQNKF